MKSSASKQCVNYFNFKKDDEGKGLCKTALFAITIYYVMPQNEGENCGIKGKVCRCI